LKKYEENGEKTTYNEVSRKPGVYSRRKICGNLEVYRPPEPLWNPRLREAATTLGVSG